MSEMIKKCKTIFYILAILLAAGCAGRQIEEKLSVHFSVDKKIERGGSLLPAGEYDAELFEYNDSEYITLVRYDVGSNTIQSFGVPTTIETDGACYPADKVQQFTWNISVSSGREILNLELVKNGKIYRSSLYLHLEQPNPSAKLSDISSEFILDEIEIIRSAHSLLESFSEVIWPDWKSWKDIDFKVIFPDKSELLITKENEASGNFWLIEEENIFGKNIFINDKGLASDYNGENIIGFHGQPANWGLTMLIITGDETRGSNPRTESHQFKYSRRYAYIHEAFHYEQNCRRVEAEKNGFKKEYYPAVKSGDLNPELLELIELEGRFLLKAINEKNNDDAFNYLTQAFEACKNIQNRLNYKELSYNSRTTSEGTARYTEYCSAEKDNTEEALIFIQNLNTEMAEDVNDVYSRFSHIPYSYGLCWALLLDRFAENWKEGFMEKNHTLYDAAELLLIIPD